MKHRSIFFLVLAFGIIKGQTQAVKRTCGTEIPGKAWDEWFNGQVEAFIKSNPQQKGESANYTIPVVFHVIHGNESVGNFPNLSQAQINSQVNILNSDFAGTGFNAGNIVNTNFSPSLIANCNINFCLAEKDLGGSTLAEKGIHRVSYTAMGWANPGSYTTSAAFRGFIDNTVKPATIWDPKRYLNIWLTDVHSSVGLLGYATFPSGSGLTGVPGAGTTTDDGVWCWAKAIGDVGTVAPFYGQGRTATHEIGHYLGLRHIWGDASCGTDYCNDTPTQQMENTNCPSFPSASCSNGPNGDMFMNFMDYCYDACLYMFTNDQRTRMQTAMANSPFRKMLTASAATLCNTACSYTLTNFSNADTLLSYRRVTASPTDVSCQQGNGKAGYISGTNCYGDLEKAEFISASKYNNVTNPIITGVVVLFFQYGNLGTNGTGNVSLKIYNGTSAATQPGSLLGSTVANLSTIAASTNTTSIPYCGNPNLAYSVPLIMPYKFVFTTPIAAPQFDGFYASVVLPTLLGDTVSIMDENTAVTNTAWEKWSDMNTTWHNMKEAWGNTRNFNLAILPVIECGPVGLKENSLLSKNVDLFPNPISGNFTIITNLPYSQSITVQVYNLLGEVVYREQIDQARQSAIEVNMPGRPNGIYFVEVNNGQEKVVKRLVIAK